MNTIKQLLSSLLITFFVTSNIYAQPCIGDNCLASIGTSKKLSTKSSFTTVSQEEEMVEQESMELDMVPLDDNEGMIALTDNTAYYSDNQIDSANLDNEMEYINEEPNENSIVLIDETVESIDNTILASTTDITYACDFAGAEILVCDDITKECQCV